MAMFYLIDTFITMVTPFFISDITFCVLNCILVDIYTGSLGFLCSLFVWILFPSSITWLLAEASISHHLALSVGLLMTCQLASPKMSHPRDK